MKIYKTLICSALAVSTMSLTACFASNYGFQQTLPPTISRNPINVAESVERLELYARPNGLVLSARDELAIAQFLDGYRRQGSGPLFINRPAAQIGNAGTRQAETIIRSLMQDGGIQANSLQSGQYISKSKRVAPVIVSYRSLKAIPDNCARAADLTKTFANQPPENFGCFHAANLAAQISDPRQLLEPYEFGKPDSQRRQVIYDRFIQGELTGSEFPARQVSSTTQTQN